LQKQEEILEREQLDTLATLERLNRALALEMKRKEDIAARSAALQEREILSRNILTEEKEVHESIQRGMITSLANKSVHR